MRIPFDLMPVDFWPYTSWVTDRFLEIDTWNGEKHTREARVAEANALRNELLELFQAFGIPCAIDNKIVFECATPSGKKVYIGFYDGNMSAGFDMESDSWNYNAKRQAWGPKRSDCVNHACSNNKWER